MDQVIKSVEQVTPAWLTRVLRAGGKLTAGQVRSIEVTGVHDEQV